MQDVRDRRKKVDVLGDAVERAGLGTHVVRMDKNLWDPAVVRTVAECDVVFGCMDSIDGRYLLNALADVLHPALFRYRRAHRHNKGRH